MRLSGNFLSEPLLQASLLFTDQHDPLHITQVGETGFSHSLTYVNNLEAVLGFNTGTSAPAVYLYDSIRKIKDHC